MINENAPSWGSTPATVPAPPGRSTSSCCVPTRPAPPTVILGAADSTRLQLRRLGGSGGVRLSAGADPDAFAEFQLVGLEFVLSAEGADGFIAAILPKNGVGFGTDLTIGLSTRDGIYFRGTTNLEITVPAHVQLGPVEVQGLTISATPSADGIPIGLGATLRVSLGPLTASVEGIGLTATLGVRSAMDGNLGPVDLGLGFKPPKGIGLAVDAGMVTGGGYLYFDPDTGEYAGAIDLTFAGTVAVKAIGIITTKMPDGSPGFSLLIIMSAEFATGIQLGFGFTLLAVGGILGLNRTMNLQALIDGVRAGDHHVGHVPQGHHRQRTEDHQRPADVLPAPRRRLPGRADGQAGLG